MVSKDWVREKILKIEQPSEILDNIWKEKAANLKAMQYFTWQLAQIQSQMAAAMKPPAPPPQQAPGAEEELPPVPPEGGTGGPEPGMEPNLEGLPQQMGQGGMQPPIDGRFSGTEPGVRQV